MDKKFIPVIAYGLIAISMANILLSIGIIAMLLVMNNSISSQLSGAANSHATIPQSNNTSSATQTNGMINSDDQAVERNSSGDPANPSLTRETNITGAKNKTVSGDLQTGIDQLPSSGQMPQPSSGQTAQGGSSGQASSNGQPSYGVAQNSSSSGQGQYASSQIPSTSQMPPSSPAQQPSSGQIPQSVPSQLFTGSTPVSSNSSQNSPGTAKYGQNSNGSGQASSDSGLNSSSSDPKMTDDQILSSLLQPSAIGTGGTPTGSPSTARSSASGGQPTATTLPSSFGSWVFNNSKPFGNGISG
ncbi:MAG TPA: hypothetical protein VK436_01375 [Methanocella sp.]|nr:hypothetical protein [Methanocella sp.]